MKKLNYVLSIGLSFGILFISACSDDDAPPAENEEEIITDITLTFAPQNGSEEVVALAVDPDGEGPQDIEVQADIVLEPNTLYILSIDLQNSVEGESITEEIQEEATAHQFFFAWTGEIFESPNGLGNYLDDGTGNGPYGNGVAINYNDVETDYQTSADEDGVGPRDLPVGLSTIWETTAATIADEQFRIVLKHQPGQKSASSGSNTGETDVDLVFNISVE